MPFRFHSSYGLPASFYSQEDSRGGSLSSSATHILFASRNKAIATKLRGVAGEKWGKMTEPDRLDFVKDVAASIASLLPLTGRLPEVRVVNFGFDAAGQIVRDLMTAADPHIHGCYDPDLHAILLNRPTMRDPVHATIIIAHELRHVYQVEQVEAWRTGRAHDPQAVVWAPELAHPVDPVKDMRGYSNMAIEIDARAYQADILLLSKK